MNISEISLTKQKRKLDILAIRTTIKILEEKLGEIAEKAKICLKRNDVLRGHDLLNKAKDIDRAIEYLREQT